MPYPFYPLYRRKIDEQWILQVDVDQQGNVICGMSWTFGVFDLSTFRIRAKPSKIPSKALSEINRILRSLEVRSQ